MPRCLTCGRRASDVHPPCGSAPPAPVPTPGPLPEVPGFRSLRLLGQGGFGRVALAEREPDGERVALKVARAGLAAATAQLHREERALRAIGPPAVPAVLAAGVLTGGSPWLALELLPGSSLADRLEAWSGPLPPAEALAAARAVLEALAALHAAGWAHGDLKPENALLEGGAGGAPLRARLLDLGLAEPLGAEAGPAGPALAGTAEYMAPELCEGHQPSARADVYAAGAVLFELFTGRPPFFGPPGEVRHAHLTRRPPRPSALGPVPPALEELLLRCLAKSPAERPASAAELLEGLRRAEAEAPAPRSPAPAAPGPAPPAARRRVGVAFLESPAGPVAVQAAAAALGGSVGHAERGRYALVFDPSAGENPVRLALRAARAAVARGLAARARVDLLAMTAQPRPGGGERYLSAAFARAGSWPSPADPAGVLVTDRAAEVLPGEPLSPVEGREGLLAAEAVEAASEPATVVRQGAAPLLGRDEELRGLIALARAAFLGRRPTVAQVIGEAGHGKTHLCAVLSEGLRMLGPAPEVLEVRARPSAEAGEGGVLRALLRSALDLPPGAIAAPGDGGQALLSLALPEEAAGELWPGAALALGWLDPAAPALRARAAAPGALVSLEVRAAGAVLRRRASRRPLAVLLDDAHLADAAALDALELAALAEGGAPIFACALGRPQFAASRPAWGERAAATRGLALGALLPEVAAEVCRRLLRPAEDVPARALDRLVERARGVPLLLVELVRGLKRDGAIRRHAGGVHYLATDELDRVPDMPVVEWLAERELRGLPADLAAHAGLVALVGDELASGEVRGVLAGLERAGHGAAFPLDAEAATRRLLALGILAEHRGGRVGFRLPLLRDAVARSVPDALRAAIHEAAWHFYGQEGTLPAPVRLRRLAGHAAHAGHAGEAAAAHLALARGALARHDFVEAEALLTRALEWPGADPALRLEALRGRGNARVRLGRLEDAVGDLGAARELARAGGDRDAEVECLLDEATARDWSSDFARSAERLEEASALAAPSDGALLSRLELGRGRSLFRMGRWAEAAAALETAAALAERAGDRAYESLVAALLLLGTALPPLGRKAEAATALDRAADLAAARGDLLHLGATHINRRNLLVAGGDLAGAIWGQLESIRIARELGLAGIEYMSEFNIAELYYQAGDLPSAAPHQVRALEFEERHPEIAPVPAARLLGARMAAFAGGPGARAQVEELAAARARAAEGRGAVFGPSEAVLCDLVDLAIRPGTPPAGEWAALLRRSASHSVEQEPIEVRELHGLSLLRAGQREEGRAALREALALCDRIPSLLRRRIEAALAGAA